VRRGGEVDAARSDAKKLVTNPIGFTSLLPHLSAFYRNLSSECPSMSRVTKACISLAVDTVPYVNMNHSQTLKVPSMFETSLPSSLL
jgi:hypothetical protein